ncbi:MAG: hypothetical protein HC938_17215 [Nitrospira sp.]|nr:hypothetical protein [Nitrospira sp.]
MFNKAPVSDFSKSLAGDIVKRYPPAIDAAPDKRPSVNRLTRIVEDACARVAIFQGEHRLGWYGKAKLGNSIRWELTELGYTKEFVSLVTEAVIVNLGKVPKP